MTQKRLIFTIDDGPTSDFRRKITYLHQRNIPAVLFCIGERIQQRKEEVVDAIRRGFTIGNHSWSHAPFSTLTLADAKEEILRTEHIIETCYKEANVERSHTCFRFPQLDTGGEHSEELQKFLREHTFYGLHKSLNINYEWFQDFGSHRDTRCTYDAMDQAPQRCHTALSIQNLSRLTPTHG